MPQVAGDTSGKPLAQSYGRSVAGVPSKEVGVPSKEVEGSGKPPTFEAMVTRYVDPPPKPAPANRLVVPLLAAIVVLLLIVAVVGVLLLQQRKAIEAGPRQTASPVAGPTENRPSPSPSASPTVPPGGATPSADVSPVTQASNSFAPGGVPVGTGVARYFDELVTSQRNGCSGPFNGSFTMGPKNYDRSVAITSGTCAGGGPNYVEYALDPTYGCTKFSATIGVPNGDNERARANIGVSVDGQPIKPVSTFARGMTSDLAANVKPSSIIRFQMENTTPNAGFLSVTAVFGSAQLSCAN